MGQSEWNCMVFPLIKHTNLKVFPSLSMPWKFRADPQHHPVDQQCQTHPGRAGNGASMACPIRPRSPGFCGWPHPWIPLPTRSIIGWREWLCGLNPACRPYVWCPCYRFCLTWHILNTTAPLPLFLQKIIFRTWWISVCFLRGALPLLTLRRRTGEMLRARLQLH